MIFLSEDIPNPYTDSKLPTNLKPRTVFCPHCKYEVSTNLPGAKCGRCHSGLITIIK